MNDIWPLLEISKCCASFFFFSWDLRSLRDHLWGTKKLLCCWNSGLTVTTSQLVKSQSSVYLISRSNKDKEKEEKSWVSESCCLPQALAFSSGFEFFFRAISWHSYSSDVCNCPEVYCESDRESFYPSLGRGVLMWPGTQLSAFMLLAPGGNAKWQRWHFLAFWEFACPACQILRRLALSCRPWEIIQVPQPAYWKAQKSCICVLLKPEI